MASNTCTITLRRRWWVMPLCYVLMGAEKLGIIEDPRSAGRVVKFIARRGFVVET